MKVSWTFLSWNTHIVEVSTCEECASTTLSMKSSNVFIVWFWELSWLFSVVLSLYQMKCWYCLRIPLLILCCHCHLLCLWHLKCCIADSNDKSVLITEWVEANSDSSSISLPTQHFLSHFSSLGVSDYHCIPWFLFCLTTSLLCSFLSTTHSFQCFQGTYTITATFAPLALDAVFPSTTDLVISFSNLPSSCKDHDCMES